MRILIAAGIFLCINFVFSFEDGSHIQVDCSMRSSSCEHCHAEYPLCYWCDGTCKRYYGKSFASIECPGRVTYERCEAADKRDSSIRDIMKMVTALKKEQESESRTSNLGEIDSKVSAGTRNASRKSKLKRLLKLLKMLAYLEKMKKKKNTNKNTSVFTGSSVNNEKNFLKPEVIDKNVQNINNKPTNSDLDALIKLAGKEKSHQKSKIDLNFETSTRDPLVAFAGEKPSKPSKSSLLGSKKNTVKAPEPKVTIKPIVTYSNATRVPSTAANTERYCELFEQEDECNGDQDCSWCNILEMCIGRKKEDFKHCIGNKRNKEIDQPVSDESNVCSEQTSCTSCTKRGKCYWCEKTKSCHIYPFFGFIPHNCPTNMWYYKECDVQLAIFIILFPLLMILLSMAIFYVCLRYCYYRRRTLKVQLFEKPEIFERRKGKKVYFVGGDDEDEESRSEQIRKKYNLPQEKEPLISP